MLQPGSLTGIYAHTICVDRTLTLQSKIYGDLDKTTLEIVRGKQGKLSGIRSDIQGLGKTCCPVNIAWNVVENVAGVTLVDTGEPGKGWWVGGWNYRSPKTGITGSDTVMINHVAIGAQKEIGVSFYFEQSDILNTPCEEFCLNLVELKLAENRRL